MVEYLSINFIVKFVTTNNNILFAITQNELTFCTLTDDDFNEGPNTINALERKIRTVKLDLNIWAVTLTYEDLVLAVEVDENQI